MTKTEDWIKLLDRVIKNDDLKERKNAEIERCIDLIRQGVGRNDIQAKIGKGKTESDILYELARSRISASGKYSMWNRLWLDHYLSSYSTPEIVCKYRSGRIKDSRVIDVGTGSGMQAIFLSQTNDKTTSIDIKPERSKMARLNSMEYKTGNLKFLTGDVYNLSESFEIDENTVIFSDPERPPTTAERTMNQLIPSPENLIRVFGDRTSNFVFDLPPQMRMSNIGIEGEKEYLSIDGQLNRLTLYCGNVAEDEVSATVLPSNYRITGEPEEIEFPSNPVITDIIAVPDVAITYAMLLGKLSEHYPITASWKDNRRAVFSADEHMKGFPGYQYRVLSRVDSSNVNLELKRLNSRRVFPRFLIKDSGYYEIKRKWEDGLTGTNDIYVFRKGEIYFLCEEVI